MPDPAQALELSKETFELFRRDYLVASVVVLLLVNGVWAWAFSRVWRALASAQEARVLDQKEDRDRLARILERNTESNVIMLRGLDELRNKGRRAMVLPGELLPKPPEPPR